MNLFLSLWTKQNLLLTCNYLFPKGVNYQVAMWDGWWVEGGEYFQLTHCANLSPGYIQSGMTSLSDLHPTFICLPYKIIYYTIWSYYWTHHCHYH